MKTPICVAGLVVGAALVLSGCENEATAPAPATKPEPGSGNGPAAAKRVRIGKNVYFEKLDGDRRRVVVEATVCLREGLLELFLCRKRFKEHEAILAADIDARDIHKGLLLTGAKPGSVMKYVEKNGQYEVIPPKGQRIKVTVEYEDKGKRVSIPAQKWIRHIKTKKDLDLDWVFAGSLLIPDNEDKNKPPLYAANGGDVICVSNFESALLDLPVKSSKDNPELMFEPHTERIPAGHQGPCLLGADPG